MLTYTIRAGDTPLKIAQGFTGNAARYTELLAANPQIPTAVTAEGYRTFAYMPGAGKSLMLPDTWRGQTGVRPRSVRGAGQTGTAESELEPCDASDQCFDESGQCRTFNPRSYIRDGVGDCQKCGGIDQPRCTPCPTGQCWDNDQGRCRDKGTDVIDSIGKCNPKPFTKAGCADGECWYPPYAKCIQVPAGQTVDQWGYCYDPNGLTPGKKDPANCADKFGGPSACYYVENNECKEYHGRNGTSCSVCDARCKKAGLTTNFDDPKLASDCVCGSGTQPQPGCKNQGTSCGKDTDCCSNLSCVNGLCQTAPQPTPEKKTDYTWLWGVGLAVGAVAVGSAVYFGSQDEKGRFPKARGVAGARSNPARKVTPETVVYTASAWWEYADPSMGVVALTAQRAEKEILKQMRSAARDVYESTDERTTLRELQDQIQWSDVHPSTLEELASEREIDEAIASLEKRGVWYPEMP